MNLIYTNNINRFTLVGKQRRWFLACENETEKREWTRMFMRLRDTKAPLKNNNDDEIDNNNNNKMDNKMDNKIEKSLNLGPHFKTVTQVKWCPTIPGILATGSEDESVKIWQTHLLDHTLIPVEYDNEKINQMLGIDSRNDSKEESSSDDKINSTYPLHAIEFQPIAEYKTSGKVTCLEWSPDGSMLVVSLQKNINDNKFGYFIQCFDLSYYWSQYDIDIDGGIGIDIDGGIDSDCDEESKTKIFTLQDHPSSLLFSNDGTFIYMSMDIDPNSEENEKRRPAFLVYLDLTQNQLHRCKTVDRIIDHQTEFIVALTMNNSRNIMIVATCTHQNNGRIIAWDIEKNQTRIIERKGTRVSKLLFTDDDSWVIIGRNNGKLEFWNSIEVDPIIFNGKGARAYISNINLELITICGIGNYELFGLYLNQLVFLSNYGTADVTDINILRQK